MPAVARLGDKTFGTCYHPSHKVPPAVSGTIVSCSSLTTCEGMGVARLGDKVKTTCGHYGSIVTCSGNSSETGEGIAHVGDKVSGVYKATITSGASKTDVQY